MSSETNSNTTAPPIDLDKSIVSIMRMLPWLVKDKGVKASIGNEGDLSIKYAPQVADVMSKAGGPPGPAIGEGVIDPQLIAQMGGQLMQNQQQQQQFAAGIPDLVSSLAYRGALTNQAAGWPQRQQMDMQKAIMTLAGQMARQQMQGQQDQELKAAPGWESPTEVAKDKAYTEYLGRLPTPAKQTGGITPYQEQQLIRGFSKDTQLMNEKATKSIGMFLSDEIKDDNAEILADRFYRTYPTATSAPLVVETPGTLWGTNKERVVVDLRDKTILDVSKKADELGIPLEEALLRIYQSQIGE